jgi:predicted phosphohydrolase
MWKDDVAIAGSRLWDTSEFSFNEVIDFKENSRANPLAHTDTSEEKDRIFQRELGRLEMSLKSMNALAKTRIVMTHYPPIGLDLKDSLVSRLLEKYQVQICVFGHLHNVKRGLSLFGTHHGIQYALTSCDYLDFRPLKL